MAPSGAWFVAVACATAIVLASVAYLVVGVLLDENVSLVPTVLTSLVVGAFVALLFLAPRRGSEDEPAAAEAEEEE